MANENTSNAKKSVSSKNEPSLYELLQQYNKMAYRRGLYVQNKNDSVDKQKKDYNKSMYEANREKISKLEEVLRKVEFVNKEYFKKLGINISNLRLNATYSFGENFRGKNIVALQYFGQNMESGKQGKNQIFLHMNMEKLLQLPAMEVYAILSSHVIDSVMANEKLHENFSPERREEYFTYKQMKLDIANQGKLDRATELFAKYIKAFLEKGDDSYSNEITATEIAIQLRDQMTPEEQKAFLAHNFAIFDSKLSETKGDLIDYRMAAIKLQRDEIGQMMVNKDALNSNLINVETLANDQQYAQMAAIKLQSDFDKIKNDMSNQSALKGFCTNFVNEFVSSHGMQNVELRFVNNPNSTNYGAYHDKGSSQWIEVNLANINSVTELASTLAHELTHAGDSSLNKQAGNTTKNGRGLLNNISDNISGSGFNKDSAAYKLLSEVNESCYYINPNERHARQSELGALMIMSEMAVNDPILQKQLKESAASYRTYLNQTIEQVELIEKNISTYRQRLDSLKISKNSDGYEMIEKRIAYLEALRSNNSVGKEKSILGKLGEIDKVIDRNGGEDLVGAKKLSDKFEADKENSIIDDILAKTAVEEKNKEEKLKKQKEEKIEEEKNKVNIELEM